ncbi:MAG TPA: LysR family transcriptional regulator [Candidatus Sulfotelmatobacter sp.]|jgi:DNA-binding transcriptional LysR family regulator|nr:LysR family transcriptional regulator [Candidatus Sulfotelmatobacter sp.]
MELRHLRAFATLAEELHFGRAAERLGIAQPPLSIQIQSLEATLGVKLFDRSRRHVALTEAGALLLPEAQATLAQADKTRRTAQRAARGEMGRLEIGFTGSAPFNAAMPGIISRFRRSWPDLHMVLREMSTTEQLRAMADGQLDIGFIRPGHPSETVGVESRVVLNEPLLAALPADHPLAERRSLSLIELAEESFILHPRAIGTGLYDKVISLCAAAGFHPHVVLEAHQMSTMIALTATGLGVAVVPEAMKRLQVEGCRFVALEDAGASMVLAVAHRLGDDRSSVRRFLETATSYSQ